MDLASLGFHVDSSGLRRATGDLDRLDRQSQTTTSTVQKLGVAFGALGIGAALQGSLASFANFERGLIGVGKTSDITGAALSGLGQSIRELSRDLPVTSAELLAIAQSAGQLGVSGTDNILRFTETVGKLGLASDLSGEQAATSLARILTVTGTAISEVDRLGSTIVQLGNNFAATESEIAAVATRVSQSTSQFDVSAAQVLGISTALKAVGVQAESGGTQIGLSFQAINDAIRNGGDELARLEKITGRTGDALREDFFNGNSAKVFQDFVNGLGQIQQSGGDVSASLEAMGLNGVRATQVLGTLATRTDVLADALSQANREWDANIALNKEAAIASESFSAQLQLVKNAADEAASAVGSIIAPAALDGLDSFRDASLAVAENIEEVADAAAVVAIVVGGKLAGALAIGTAAFVTNAKASLLNFAATIRATNAQALASQALVRRTLAEKNATLAVLQKARIEVAATAGTQGNAAAVTAQTAAVNSATIASARHRVALGAQTVAMSAAAVAAGVLSRAMAFVGGPVGVLLIAAASLYYFREELGLVRPELTAATGEVDAFAESIDGISEAALRLRIENIKTEMEEVAAAAEVAAKRVADAAQMTSNTSGSGGILGVDASGITEYARELTSASEASRNLQEQTLTLQGKLDGAEVRLKEFTEARKEDTAASVASAKATAETTAALLLELEYLRAENALVEAGISASEAEIAVMETKKELMLENKGLTAAEAVEYVALEKAIRGALDAEQEQASINTEASGIAASLLSEEDAVLASYQRRRDIILNSTNKTGEAQKNLLVQLEDEKNKELSDLNAGYWEKYLESAQENLQNFDELSKTVIDNFAANFGSAFESIIFDSESLGDAMYGLSDAILRGVVNSLAQIAAQWAINQALILAGIGVETGAVVASEATKAGAIAASTTATQASYAATATANALAQQQMAGLAAYASTAAIPVAGPALAPAAYLTAVAATTPMVTAVSALTAAGMAHDGIDSVPEDGTWNLQKGERVVTSETSAKLDTTLDRVGSGGGGISVTINDQTTTSTGHDVQTQETTGPEGQRQMQITIRDTVRRQVMSGEFDKQLGSKFDLKSKGRRV